MQQFIFLLQLLLSKQEKSKKNMTKLIALNIYFLIAFREFQIKKKKQIDIKE